MRRSTSNSDANMIRAVAVKYSDDRPIQGPSRRRRSSLRAHPILKHNARSSSSGHRTWIISLAGLATILFLYALNPIITNPLHSLLIITGQEDSKTETYIQGPRDMLFTVFHTLTFTFLRSFTMRTILQPLCTHYNLARPSIQRRFKEQGYTALYCLFSVSFGIYLLRTEVSNQLYPFNTTALFTTYPYKAYSGAFKTYYLVQASFWLHQSLILLLRLEKPRKDIRELTLHHVITLALIGLSYRFHFCLLGLLVFLTHDASDFFLATSKMLNYVDARITAPFFVLFVAVWVWCRHYLHLSLLWAVAVEWKAGGPNELSWERGEYKCGISQAVTFALLLALQGLNVFWSGCVYRVAKNHVFNKEFVDERSCDEGEDGVDKHQ